MQKVLSIKESPITFYILIGAVVFSAILYIYCINASVRNVVARKDTEKAISTLKNKVSELEYSYMSKESTITIDSAQSLGLSELKDKIFISKNGSTKALSFNSR